MSIKSTSYITKERAIERIQFIANLLIENEYREIEENVSESDFSVQDFVMDVDNRMLAASHLKDIEKYTDSMIEDIIDEPFYRFSMFDNYFIGER